MTTLQLRTCLDCILKFMAPHWSWVNCHMVNYLTDDHWKNFVPLELKKEISSYDSIEECIEAVFWNNANNDCTNFPEFTKFRQQVLQHCLQAFEEIVKTPQDFKVDILGKNPDLKQQIKIREFLTEKKRHEVEVTTSLVNDIIVFSPWQKHCVVVDAGDGKGYLSSRLSLEYGYKVLGIDSNTANTDSAIERNKKLRKAWHGLKEKAELELKGITPTRGGKWKQKLQQKSAVNKELVGKNDNNNYKTIDKFITSDMDLDGIIQQQFSESSIIQPIICLTGLHTCGNLAASCLKLFNRLNSCKIMCNIGCCYHQLKEEFSEPEFFGNKQVSDLNQEYGFPLSQYLKEKKIALGRNARMLAAQSIERTMEAKELPNISLYYRALLELLICEQYPDLKAVVQVGKIRKFSSFVEYVELCKNKYPNLNLKEKRIAEIANLEEKKQSKKYLNLFYLLRMLFAPVLESIILLDRLLYLKELGHMQSFLIPVFDPIVSPRHFAIVALKNK